MAAARRMPHASGDEPLSYIWNHSRSTVCPTRVGMNRSHCWDIAGLFYVCPTRVGMNRISPAAVGTGSDVCPTRVGMNRKSHAAQGADHKVCPTRVGMNRPMRPLKLMRRSMPHASGDEPISNQPCITPSSRMSHASGDEPLLGIDRPQELRVCPTRVGMNRGKYRNG